MKLLSLTLLLLAAFVAAQSTNPGNFVAKVPIDNFLVGFNQALYTINTTTFPVTRDSIYTDPGEPVGLLGGERDLRLTVESGTLTRTLSTSVANGEWEIATPNGASGFVLLQLDGKDNSVNIRPGGLGSIDLTVGGTAQAFNISLETDIATVFTFSIYSPNGNQCENEVSIPDGEGITVNYYVRFSEFSGNCNFADVGAIEIFVEAFNNVDALCRFFGTVGEPVSPSPVPSPIPTRSPTPSPLPSIELCLCHCPVFTCELVFDLDDDENDAFYFDDDDNGAGNSGGNGGGNGGNDNDDGENDDGENDEDEDASNDVSSASAFSISLALLVTIVAFIY